MSWLLFYGWKFNRTRGIKRLLRQSFPVYCLHSQNVGTMSKWKTQSPWKSVCHLGSTQEILCVHINILLTPRSLTSETRTGKYKDVFHSWKSQPSHWTYLRRCRRLPRLCREGGWWRVLRRWSESLQSPRRPPPAASGPPRSHGKLQVPGEKEKSKAHLDCEHGRLAHGKFLSSPRF